ncbi:WD repeat-containing protein on Y chromosome-like isoform X2 [Trachemys scripta elegans]|uniref:WD repeat-containing protein on Y chromosome-like isoform X2 n=1 Tax=Trachemys scripta elegans TaxID=31138 RepID=UPI001554734A|nr:WD repeat-containing protein on Y chromosome-like isoform X2 [Trachemys scripta elegans]
MKNHHSFRKEGEKVEMSVMKKKKQNSSWCAYKQEVPASITCFDQSKSPRLEEELELGHLQLLEALFATHSSPEGEDQGREAENKDQWVRPCRKQKVQPPGSLTLQEFHRVLSELTGSESWNNQSELLFNKVDTSCDGLIDWNKFCTYLLLYYKERDHMKTKKEIFLGREPLIRHSVQNKLAPTTRILAISSPPPLWFVSVSKGGVLTTWDSALHIQKTYEIATDSKGSQAEKRRLKSWTTDAVYMANVHKIAVATTCRDIHFFDVSTANLVEEFHLFALKNVPTSLYYRYNAKEIKEHSKLLQYQTIPEVHEEAVSQIQYVAEGELIITSSGSPKTSVVIMDILRKRKVYTWKIKKGVKCFDYCKSLSLLVTGGVDHAVQLWNQYVPSWPVATFQGHCTTILAVAIHEPRGHVFSYSKDSVLKVWDIFSQACLQTLALKFPCVQPEQTLEQGDFPFLLIQQSPHLLLVSCADYIGLLKLAHVSPEEEMLATHDAPLCGALYNTFFHQVVTGGDDATVAVWDVETGAKRLLINNAHGKEEITCMALDNSQHRLITAARNGTIKVWHIQTGHNLHQLEVVEEAEVTGLVALQDQSLLTVGWNQKIVLYDFCEPEALYVTAHPSWKGGQLHKEDILTVDYCPSLGLLASASFDGEIIMWDVESQSVYLYLRQAQPERSHPPVDKLLFLQHRSLDGVSKDSAILVSSDAGNLRWWSVLAEQREFGFYYAPAKEDASVTGLSANQMNSVLVSGDTCGFIQVWDISDYGLSPRTQGSLEKPPLLCSWRAHNSTVVSVEHFMFGSDSFILSGSSDRSARLWTPDGKFVGTFGQEKRWDLKNPSTFAHPKDPWSERKEIKKKRTPIKQLAYTDGRLFSSEELVRNVEGETEEKVNQEINGGSTMEEREQLQEFQLPRADGAHPSTSPSQISAEDTVQSRLTTPQSFTGTSNQRKHEWQSLFRHHLENDLVKRITGRKARRRVFGAINANKFNRFGTLCSPFHALATPEMQKLTLPQDLPMTPRMLRQGIVCSTEMDLRSLPLTFPDLDAEKTEEPSLSERKKSSVHMKTPLLPPLVKPTRASLSHSKKAKSFQFPSQFPQ